MDNFDEQLRKLIHRERHNFAGSSSQVIVELVNLIFDFAIKVKATDLHLEPFENTLRVRYRIDGYLQEFHQALPLNLAEALILRIKVLARMDTTTVFLPSDGAIKYGNIEMRVASMPTSETESLTIRILDSRVELHNLHDLGFTAANEKIFRQLINAKAGIVILTGAMNSGKSTTLYAALRELNKPERSIMTLEDPIEQHITGIGQVQVNDKVGLTFATGLRAMLRMDCNCLMVGEIRDIDTAKIAIRAALTGHLIFTTLHSKDSCGAIFRMLEMGIEPYLLAATLNGIVAQRLVRKLCQYCKRKCASNELEKKLIGAQSIYTAVGCDKCRRTGYSGRIAIHEILCISKELRELILNSHSLEEVKTFAIENGLKTLANDAFEKVRNGLTTVKEIQRVMDAEE